MPEEVEQLVVAGHFGRGRPAAAKAASQAVRGTGVRRAGAGRETTLIRGAKARHVAGGSRLAAVGLCDGAPAVLLVGSPEASPEGCDDAAAFFQLEACRILAEEGGQVVSSLVQGAQAPSQTLQLTLDELEQRPRACQEGVVARRAAGRPRRVRLKACQALGESRNVGSHLVSRHATRRLQRGQRRVVAQLAAAQDLSALGLLCHVVKQPHSWPVGAQFGDLEQRHNLEASRVTGVASRIEEVSRHQNHVEDFMQGFAVLYFFGGVSEAGHGGLEGGDDSGEFFLKEQALHTQSIVRESQYPGEECLRWRQLSRFALEQRPLERGRRLRRREQRLQRTQLVGAQAASAASSAAQHVEKLSLVRLAA